MAQTINPEYSTQYANNPTFHQNTGPQFTNWNTPTQFATAPVDQPPPYHPPPYSATSEQRQFYLQGVTMPQSVNYPPQPAVLNEQHSQQLAAAARRAAILRRVRIIRIVIAVVSLTVMVVCACVAYYATN